MLLIQLNVAENMVGGIADGRPLRQLLFRVGDRVRAVAQQQLGMHVPRGLGDHARRAHLLEHGGDQQAAGEV